MSPLEAEILQKESISLNIEASGELAWPAARESPNTEKNILALGATCRPVDLEINTLLEEILGEYLRL